MNIFMFPGQGTQYSGMFRTLNLYLSEIQGLFKSAHDITGIDVRYLCEKANDSILKETKNTQLAVFMMDLAFFKVLHNRNVFPDVVMGHSLGQFAALVACGAMKYEDALKLVQQRSKLMSNVTRNGCLASIIGVEVEKVDEICEEYQTQGILSIALINTPKQVVIGGDRKLVELAAERLKNEGAIKTVFLSVSAAFHTKHMEEILCDFNELVSGIYMSEPNCDIILNCTAEQTRDINKIRQDIVNQCCNKVRWSESIHKMLSYEKPIICEVGVGKSLAGMVRNINKIQPVYCCSDIKQLQDLLKINE